MPSLRHRGALAALRLLPKNVVSRWAGRAAAVRLPRRWQAAEIRLFAHMTGIDLAEVRDPIESFASLQEFFTRALPDGARPVDGAPDAVVAPCEGRWGASGIVSDGVVLQVKGRPYSLAALCGDVTAARGLEGGPYATFYLSPRDYHRFHMPCAARVLRATYLPGTLWPVNRLGTDHVEGLFAQNERLCAELATGTADRVDLCLVAVGATLVGKVRVTFDDLSTNLRGAGPVTRRYADPRPRFAKGEEWGRFEFGSTIVMVAAPGVIDLDARPPGTPLRLGQRIGRLCAVA